jgi:hypothetical protein
LIKAFIFAAASKIKLEFYPRAFSRQVLGFLLSCNCAFHHKKKGQIRYRQTHGGKTVDGEHGERLISFSYTTKFLYAPPEVALAGVCFDKKGWWKK